MDNLNDRERATILAGLRLWQTPASLTLPPDQQRALNLVASNDGQFHALDADEMDALIDKLNPVSEPSTAGAPTWGELFACLRKCLTWAETHKRFNKVGDGGPLAHDIAEARTVVFRAHKYAQKTIETTPVRPTVKPSR
jgi:hypothetical protein